ncbi:MAG: HigA family addiction module antitoxin [bacterium]
MKRKTLLPPVHPGEILAEDFMKPLKLSAYRVAKDLGVSPIAISQIIRRKRGVSAEMALRLACYTNMSANFWQNVQADYDLEMAKRSFQKRFFRQIKPVKSSTLAHKF